MLNGMVGWLVDWLVADYATIGFHSAGEKVAVNFRPPFVAQLPALASELKAQFEGALCFCVFACLC
jgi:hypothetical protein